MSRTNEFGTMNDPRTVLHWYDFICPFCYVGQQRNAILVQRGLHVVELPFQIYPETGLRGSQIRDALWPRPSGCGSISQVRSPSYIKTSSLHISFWVRISR